MSKNNRPSRRNLLKQLAAGGSLATVPALSFLSSCAHNSNSLSHREVLQGMERIEGYLGQIDNDIATLVDIQQKVEIEGASEELLRQAQELVERIHENYNQALTEQKTLETERREAVASFPESHRLLNDQITKIAAAGEKYRKIAIPARDDIQRRIAAVNPERRITAEEIENMFREF